MQPCAWGSLPAPTVLNRTAGSRFRPRPFGLVSDDPNVALPPGQPPGVEVLEERERVLPAGSQSLPEPRDGDAARPGRTDDVLGPGDELGRHHEILGDLHQPS